MKPENPLADGTKLQLPVYLAAVPGVPEVVPMYWFISSAAGFDNKKFEISPENLRRYEQTLGAILDGVRRGAFPAVPSEWNDFYGVWENCRYCDFARLCSRRRDDAFEDKRGHDGVQPWLQVALTARGEAAP
jgi:hypothetical protein